jgi:hypothetical protein
MCGHKGRVGDKLRVDVVPIAVVKTARTNLAPFFRLEKKGRRRKGRRRRKRRKSDSEREIDVLLIIFWCT